MTNPTSSMSGIVRKGDHLGNYVHPEDYTGNAHVVKVTRSTYLFALCAAINSCNIGYDIGVSTEVGRLVLEDFDLSRRQRELFIGSLNFWAMFGALGAQYFSDQWGRRRAFVVAAVSIIIGIIITVIAQDYAGLMAGRLLVGLGIGVGLAIDPLYIAEVTPAEHRGELVTWSEIAMNVGVVFGFSTGLFLAGLPPSMEWRVMLLLGCIMPVLMIVFVSTIMPESPRWLIANNRVSEAREILSKIYPAGHDITFILNDIREAVERDAAAERAVGWGALFQSTSCRRMLLVGVGTAIAQQAVGIDAIQYYLLDIIATSGIESDSNQSLILVLLGVIKLVFIVIGGKCFDSRGRRPLFFASLIGMYVALGLVGLAKLFSSSSLSSGAQIVGLAMYLAFFSIGMGPGAWLIPSEVFSISIRAKAMSVATTMNRAVATLMSSTFLSTSHAMGFGAFCCLLAIICVLVLAFLYTYLPETKGRSLEDMAVYFAQITGDKSILEVEAEISQRRSHPGSNTVDQQTDRKPNIVAV
ncbi:hypothetical protein ACA910_021597 [Epithemia clementina (nom. ined.)]